MIGWHVFRTLSSHTSDCIVLGRASPCPGTAWIASSSIECYFVALISWYSTILHTIFTVIYCHCTHFTSKSATSCGCNSTTIVQMPKVNHQPITWVWCCTCPGTPTSQGWWRPECSSTEGPWRSQRSSTPKVNFWGSETVHEANHIHKESQANHFRWEVLESWWNLETCDSGTASSEGISRCSCRYTISVSVAEWSISQNRSGNPRSCQCLFYFHLLD